MVYASTLRHECMGVHTSLKRTHDNFFCIRCVAVSQAPIMHILTCAFEHFSATRNRAGAISGAFERGSAG